MTHRLQLFDTPDSLTETVSSFLLDAYATGANLLVIAKPRHRAALMAALARAGCFPPERDTNQGLAVLDAGDVLRQIRRHGRIDAALFDRVVKPLVQSMAATHPLYIYGELVEVCAEEADLAGTLALESLWNQLGATVPFTLLCGYSSAHFTGTEGRRVLSDICRVHTHHAANQDDMLGSWLLASA